MAKRGAKPKYSSAKQLQKKIDEYFKKGVAKRTLLVGPANNRQKVIVKVPTITGLVLYLGFCDRASFYDLELRSEFTNTIKKARTRIEKEYEEQLASGAGASAIFALKNFGWKDQPEQAPKPDDLTRTEGMDAKQVLLERLNTIADTRRTERYSGKPD